MKKIILLGAISVATLISCQKDRKEVKNTQPKLEQISNLPCTISDPLNPVDSIGEIHNEALTYLFGLNLDETLTPVQKVMHLNDFFLERWGSDFVKDSIYYQSIENQVDQIHENGFASIFSDVGIDGVVRNMIDSVLYFQNSTKDLENLICEDVLPAINYFNNEVQNSTTFTEEEKLGFFATVSTFKHSLDYWKTNDSNYLEKGSSTLQDDNKVYKDHI